MPENRESKRKLRESTDSRGLDTSRVRDTTPVVNSKDKAREKTFMDRWVEPTLAAPKASYQDHGGLPYGVLEHMQPLGEAPSAKVKARVKGEGTRKSLLGRNAANLGTEAQDTPEGSPVPSRLPLMENAEGLPIMIKEDEKDEDYAPQSGKRGERKTRSRVTKPSVRKTESAAVVTPQKSEKQAASSEPARPRGAWYSAEKLQEVIDSAKQRAHAANRPDLAVTVDEIYKLSHTDDNLKELLRKVLTEVASTEERKIFQGYVRKIQKQTKGARSHKPSRPIPEVVVNSTTPSDATRTTSSGTSEPTTVVASQTPTLPRPRISLKVRNPAKHAETQNGAHASRKESPKKRPGSAGSDSSLTQFTSDEDRPESAKKPASKANGSTDELKGRTRNLLTVNLQAQNALSPNDAGLRSPGRIGKRSSAEAFSDNEELGQPKSSSKKSKAEAQPIKLESAPPALPSDKRTIENGQADGIARLKHELGAAVIRDYDFEESNLRPAREPTVTASRSHRTRHSAQAVPTANGLSTHNTTDHNSRASSMMIDGSPLSDLSPVLSGHSTPQWANPPKNLGKRAKTKKSPEKKQTSAFGGLPVAGATEKGSPIGDDDNEEASENNDFCSACGGTGYLLCCDGCDRSFHFSCLDPPISDDAKELDEPWYCFVCIVAKRPFADSPEKPTRGLFAPLLGVLKKKNPTNFTLPLEVRDYFEGVAADKNGNFVESLSKTTRHRPGYGDEQPDYLRERDNKGNLILCYHCGLSSRRQNAIVTCDFCAQPWHLDCLDPPLANPPAVSQNGRKVHDWMCPLHADQELRKVDASVLNRRQFHQRKPKNAKLVESSLTRGFRNNGIIEILEDESESSDSEFYEHEDTPVVYKLPAKGIMLDFIDKVKTTRVQSIRDQSAHDRHRRRQRPTPTPTPTKHAPSPLEQANFAKRPFIEQQLALNLAQFASEQNDLDLGRDKVTTLVGTLIAEAPSEVIAQMMKAVDEEAPRSAVTSAVPLSPPSSEKKAEQLSADQRKELEMLQELIRRKLNCGLS